LGDREFPAKADLQSPPKLLATPDLSAPPVPNGTESSSGKTARNSGDINPEKSEKEKKSGESVDERKILMWRFAIGAIVIIGVLVILFGILFRRRAT